MKTNYLFRLSVFAILFFSFGVVENAYSQCAVSGGNDTTSYYGYSPLSCVTFNAVASGVQPISYLWSNGDTTSSITVCDSITTSYMVTVTDSTGCTAMDTVTVFVTDVRCGSNNDKVQVCHIPPGNPSNAHTICISANAVPAHLAHGCVLGSCPIPPCNVDLGDDVSSCDGSTVILDADSGYTSYLWSDSSMTSTLSVDTSGTYYVTVVDSNGCTASDTIQVTFFDNPVANAGSDTTLVNGGCDTLNGSATGGTLPYTYLWSNGDTTAMSVVCDTITASYVLVVIDSNGCTSTDTVTVFVIPNLPPPSIQCDSPKVLVCHIPPGNPSNAHTICISMSALAAHLAHGDVVGPCPSIQPIGNAGTLLISPNPFTYQTQVQFVANESGHIRVEIMNLQGELVSVIFDGEAESDVPYIFNFDANQLPGGIYVARITSGNLTPVIYKMIIMN